MNGENWDDLRLFREVARSGGLSRAAAATGASAATIGRRMLALERAMGRSLFERGATGYRLAVDGQLLLERVEAMAAAAIGDWQREELSLPIVSIGADTFALRFLTRRLPEIWTPADAFRICLTVVEPRIDFAHREAHLGIVAERPAGGNVALRRLPPRRYAPYCARALAGRPPAVWVSLGTDVAPLPWMRWVFTQPERRVTTWVNARRTLLDALCAGAGHGVLPCFVGDAEPQLARRAADRGTRPRQLPGGAG